jgi:hypothetical protein
MLIFQRQQLADYLIVTKNKLKNLIFQHLKERPKGGHLHILMDMSFLYSSIEALPLTCSIIKVLCLCTVWSALGTACSTVTCSRGRRDSLAMGRRARVGVDRADRDKGWAARMSLS